MGTMATTRRSGDEGQIDSTAATGSTCSEKRRNSRRLLATLAVLRLLGGGVTPCSGDVGGDWEQTVRSISHQRTAHEDGLPLPGMSGRITRE